MTEHPKTAAAFQRAVTKAQRLAAADLMHEFGHLKNKIDVPSMVFNGSNQ